MATDGYLVVWNGAADAPGRGLLVAAVDPPRKPDRLDRALASTPREMARHERMRPVAEAVAPRQPDRLRSIGISEAD